MLRCQTDGVGSKAEQMTCAACAHRGPVGKDFTYAVVGWGSSAVMCSSAPHAASPIWTRRCSRCGAVTCPQCSRLVQTHQAERQDRRDIRWVATALALGGLLWWSPWKPDDVTVQRGGFVPSADCQGAYENEYASTWGDADAVRSIPGCEGWLPPAPRMLPGYDQDCDDVQGPVTVDAADRYELDADGDGIGCEPDDDL